jgi:hypothetical protein
MEAKTARSVLVGATNFSERRLRAAEDIIHAPDWRVLRLSAQGLSYRRIAQSIGISASTVQSYFERAQRAGLSWPLPNGLDEAGLEARLFTRSEEELR